MEKLIGKLLKLIGRSVSTVHYIVRKAKNEKTIVNKHRTGRPKKLTSREEKYILREIKKDPNVSAPELAKIVNTNFKKEVHPELCRRILRNNDFHGRVARKKPFISKINQAKRLKFAKEYVSKDNTFWEQVIFSDESKFNIFGSDGPRYVWRKPNTEMNTKNLRPTVKHGGGSVMVWGCMAANGTGNLVFIDGILDKYKFLDILKNNLKDSATKLGLSENYYFQQDNDPKHKAKIIQEWLLYNTPHGLHTPPQSPDTNPIEHLWSEIGRRLRNCNVTSKEKIMEVWSSIEPEVTKKLVYSMPQRLKCVIEAKGGPTKY